MYHKSNFFFFTGVCNIKWLAVLLCTWGGTSRISTEKYNCLLIIIFFLFILKICYSLESV